MVSVWLSQTGGVFVNDSFEWPVMQYIFVVK